MSLNQQEKDKLKEYRIKQIEVTSFQGKDWLYAVTETGEILLGEITPGSTDAIWRRLPVAGNLIT